MHRIVPILATLLLLNPSGAEAQPKHCHAPYPAVVEAFHQQYSFAGDGLEILRFAKRESGWFAEVFQQQNGSIVRSELFWPCDSSAPRVLAGFGPAAEKEEAAKAIAAFSGGRALPEQYNFSRIPFYGYEGWDRDVIRVFGNQTVLADTLLDGLARAYSYYGDRFLNRTPSAETVAYSPLQSSLPPLGPTTPERADSAGYYYKRAIDAYDRLCRLNPGYQTRVGNALIKRFCEEMHAWSLLDMNGHSQMARQAFERVRADENIRQIGYNYLNACPKGAILLAFGDNDTYPLWYVQKKEGFRTDVTVINYSLAGYSLYIDWLRRQQVVGIRMKPVFYGSSPFLYALKTQDENKKTGTMTVDVLLARLAAQVGQNKQAQNAGAGLSYPDAHLVLRADPLRLRKIHPVSSVGNEIRWTTGAYLLLEQLLMLDIVAGNLHERPIFLTAQDEFFEKYLLPEGPVFRLLPIPAAKRSQLESEARQRHERYLRQHFRPLRNTGPMVSVPAPFGSNWAYELYAPLLMHYAAKDASKARTLYRELKGLQPEPGAFSYTHINLGLSLVRMDERADGLALLRKSLAAMEEMRRQPDGIQGPVSQKMLKEYRKFIHDALEEMKVSSAELEAFREQE